MVDVVVVVVVEESESILGQPFRKILMQHTLLHIHTLVFLITDQVPNNHPGHQISGSSGAMALLII